MRQADLLTVSECNIVIFCISAFKVTDLMGLGGDVGS